MAGRDVRAALQKYQSRQGGLYFSLKKHGDKAPVRLLYSDPTGDDLDWYPVHDLNAGKENAYSDYVLCDEEDCALCQDGSRAQLKVFIQLLDERDNKQKVFVRNDKYLQKLLAFVERYGPLVERPYEIERNGQSGDTKTTYEFFHSDKDGKTASDFPARKDLFDIGMIRRIKPGMHVAPATQSAQPAQELKVEEKKEDPFF